MGSFFAVLDFSTSLCRSVPTHGLIGTQTHTDTRTHRRTDTQTHRHTDTQTTAVVVVVVDVVVAVVACHSLEDFPLDAGSGANGGGSSVSRV